MQATWSTHSGGVSEALFGHCAGTTVRPLCLSSSGNCMASRHRWLAELARLPKDSRTSFARALFGFFNVTVDTAESQYFEGVNTKEKKKR